MFPLGTDKQYIQDMIFDVQKDIILDLTRKSSCIIVGRCSDFLLQNEPNVLNIFILRSLTRHAWKTACTRWKCLRKMPSAPS